MSSPSVGTHAPETPPAPDTPEAFTHDTLLRGRVRLVQPARGYRSSLDPVLLSAFLAPPFGRTLDIGCGSGAVSFLLLARDDRAEVTGVEIQPRLARCAALGAEANGFGARFRLVKGDARRVRLPPGGFDLVVSNPPFRPVGRGVLPPDPERATAHHEVSLTLRDWVTLAARVLRPDGRLAVIFPADRLPDLLGALEAARLPAARVRPVHPQADQPAGRVLVEARPGTPRPLVLEPALVVHAAGGYGPEVRALLGEAEAA
jgi:tRNA1(Val) A37 N6-methylase TrmN6